MDLRPASFRCRVLIYNELLQLWLSEMGLLCQRIQRRRTDRLMRLIQITVYSTSDIWTLYTSTVPLEYLFHAFTAL